MPEQAYTVTVKKDLEDLIPLFLKNRRQDVETLRVALAGGDFEQLRQLGHRMKGAGSSYGFEQVSVLGKQIEEGAKACDHAGLEALIAKYAEYLSRVNVAYN